MIERSSDDPAIPAVGKGKRGHQGHIGYLLRQAGNAHRQQMERALADIAVTPPQFMVLTMLVAYPGASDADLARLSLVTPQTMSVIVSNLERDGAVLRTAHAVHGRIQQIEVTKNGRQLLTNCRKRMQAVDEALLAGLSKDDEVVVRRWLVGVALLERGA